MGIWSLLLHGLSVQLQMSPLCVRHTEKKGPERSKDSICPDSGPKSPPVSFLQITSGKEPGWFSYVERAISPLLWKGLEGKRKPSLGENNLAVEYSPRAEELCWRKRPWRAMDIPLASSLSLPFAPCPVLSLINGLHLRELTSGGQGSQSPSDLTEQRLML